ncbi:MAG: Bax inhibitor-1/YccA family protein [Phenylobacterium sp.]|jgi:FtsH-binding integral membrane protein|uniref:Bax inhibitor-1/YccA family protein n=1 Tax=Phenylobacterium sp. TaxID=1871053 RepID=UPI001B6442F2|nr:Bax inhibitor-1/YccA family protein [Phenylobacterium sp.]MBP7648660.1 Bax inhibitor-1/YccA family protein [Phenylobacterium sp.]MBP7816164.1 Bax inhibitor-1/YccA family protein [Phenylobacterium sp.]MBP9231736.1 Bax inhibitor-1/YccA family protein [Phenylobacterium sp.]MBP9755426.1 Bax inhibitor-1/YccA family protein [Phenylobacterium sp.]
MENYNPALERGSATTDMSIDAGLRAFMLGVYNKMGLGLLVSAGLAWTTANWAPARDALFVVSDGRLSGYTLAGTILVFSPLVILLGSAFLMRNASARTASALYWTVVALIGASFGALALRYTGQSLASTFLVTAAAFGGLSLYGYTTKRDLTGLGSFLIMGVVGLLLASLVNLWLQSSLMMLMISGIGVLIFAGLTAHDTQRLKFTYHELGGDQAALSSATSFGALSLYLDFVNLFQFLLAFLGDRR